MTTLLLKNKLGEIIEFFKRNPLFTGVDICDLENISGMVSMSRLKRYETIWMERDFANRLYYAASGLIKRFIVSLDGKEQIIKLVRPGDCLGYVGMFNGGSYPDNAQALCTSVIYSISKIDIKTLLQENEKLSCNLNKQLAIETHHYISLIEDLSLRDVRGRFAKLLLEYCNELSCETFPLLTQAEMAGMIGTVREIIGRLVKDFSEKGIITAGNRTITIKDINALKIMAGLPQEQEVDYGVEIHEGYNVTKQ